jgi:hypothetical protein
MSRYAAFRRQPVEAQFEQALRTVTLPAPTRGIIANENEAYMQPGGAIVQDNWATTLRGVKLRGGTALFCDLHALDSPSWANATLYNSLGARIYDAADASFWNVAVSHASVASPTTFAADRIAHPTFWTKAPAITRLPVISAFEYVAGNSARMYAGQATKLFDVTAPTPVLIKSGQASGNYCSSQMAWTG